jgi:hypothetical protein
MLSPSLSDRWLSSFVTFNSRNGCTRSLSVLLLYLAIVTSSCGGNDSLQSNVARDFDNLEAKIVIRTFHEGRLGTLDEVQADMDPCFLHSDGSRVPKPFDGARDFISYERMDGDQQMSFNAWHGRSKKVIDIVGPEIDLAEKDFLRNKHPG